MSFLLLNPAALGLLSLTALVVAVYFLRRRPQPLEVSALFLWKQAQTKPRSALRWVRTPLWLLLLQLIAWALLVGGLADPAVYTQAQGARRLAIILDTSASMRMRTPQGSRFQEALERAQELIRQNPQAEVTVIEARQGGGVVVPLTADGARALAGLGALRPSFRGDPELADLSQWVRSQGQGQGQGEWGAFDRVVWLTDHFPADPDPAWRHLGWELERFSGGGRNAAITALSLRRQPDPDLGYEGFLRVDNYADSPLEAVLEVRAGEAVLLRTPIRLEARGRGSYAFPVGPLDSLGPPRGPLIARLEVQDDLDFDNVRRFALRAPTPPRILWQGPPERFLQQALWAAGVRQIVPWRPQMQMQVQMPVTIRPGSADVIVAYGSTLPAGTRGNVLLVNAGLEGVVHLGEPQEVQDQDQAQAQAQSLRAVRRDHPLLRGVEPADVVITRLTPAELPEGSEVVWVVRTDEGRDRPALALYADAEEGLRLAWLGFALADSNLPLTVDFPILVRHLLAWLAPSPLDLEEAVVETGAPLPLPMPPQGALVRDPQGRTQALEPGQTAFTGTDRPGFYEVIPLEAEDPARAGTGVIETQITGEAPGGAVLWAVNVPVEESDPRGEGAADRAEEVPGTQVAQTQTPTRTQSVARPLWWLLGWLGLGVLVFEWVAYERAWL